MTKADYFCAKCYRGHTAYSKIGKAHREYGEQWKRDRKAWQEKYEEKKE